MPKTDSRTTKTSLGQNSLSRQANGKAERSFVLRSACVACLWTAALVLDISLTNTSSLTSIASGQNANEQNANEQNANEQDASTSSVFDAPRRQAMQNAVQRNVLALFSQSQYSQAETLLRQFIKQLPNNSNAHYNLACALARQGKTNDSLDHLALAVEHGFRDRKHIESDDDLKSLREEERFASILKSAELPFAASSSKVVPAKATGGEAIISANNVIWDPRRGIFLTKVALAEETDAAITTGKSEADQLLRKWYEEGTAAGNHGDLYDNHDRDHSNMNFKAYPQLTRVEYSEPAKARQLNNGLQRFFLFDKVTIGNSSTALTSGPYWRCQGRHAVTQPAVANFLYLQYRANHLYFYPEHRDHDIGHNGKNGVSKEQTGFGDVFPVNSPYLILSQGSSGSDRAFMNAVASTLAAFRPEVKAQLAKTGLLMPTVQMIFRMSNRTVKNPNDYLTGHAHPTVFEKSQINAVKMVQMAHQIEMDSLPPLAQVKVVKEDEFTVGRDYFDVGDRERLLDTPCAVARVVKSTAYRRQMTMSGDASADAHNKPLKFHWVVLRGQGDKINIEKLNESGSQVKISIDYHERFPVTPDSKLESNRVDIGLFVHNGDYYSAPAFLSLYYLDNQKRVYNERKLIESIDYTTNNYVDPVLDFRKDWRDEYHYDKDDTLIGWTRIRGDTRQEFDARGDRIERNTEGEIVNATKVSYRAKVAPRKPPMLEQIDGAAQGN